MGLRDGIKLMRKNETVNFLFPSHVGFGYHGDNRRIGTNQPLLCTVTLHDFKSEVAYKKENEIKLKMAPKAPAAVKKITPTTNKTIDTITQ